MSNGLFYTATSQGEFCRQRQPAYRPAHARPLRWRGRARAAARAVADALWAAPYAGAHRAA